MPLVERLRKRAKEAESKIWDGLYKQEQEDLRALLTEAANQLEKGCDLGINMLRSVDALLKANDKMVDILNGKPV